MTTHLQALSPKPKTLAVQKWDSFLPSAQWESLCKHFVEEVSWMYGWKSDKETEFTQWHRDFFNAKPVNVHVQAAWEYVQKFLLPGHVLTRCYANAHTFGVEGYPHTDSRRDDNYTTMLYLVPEWKPEWAGETAFFNDAGDLVQSVLPNPNRLVVFNGAQVHSARSVSRICPALRRVLVFKSQAPMPPSEDSNANH